MIVRPTHWRTGPHGREPVVVAGEVLSLVSRIVDGNKTGCITSRGPRTDREIEVIAWRLGMTVVEVRAAIASGTMEADHGGQPSRRRIDDYVSNEDD